MVLTHLSRLKALRRAMCLPRRESYSPTSLAWQRLRSLLNAVKEGLIEDLGLALLGR